MAGTNGAGRRGRPARINRHRIVTVAAEMARETSLDEITMEAVAERLAVRRGALNHHVGDRAQLLELVAPLVLDFDLDPSWMPGQQAGWRTWLRAFAAELRRTLLAQPRMASYFRMPATSDRSLEQVDALGQALFRAGLDATGVDRAVTLICQIVFINVRDQLTAGAGPHPQDIEFAEALDRFPSDALPHLRAYLAAPGHRDPDAQFEFGLDCALIGIERLLLPTTATS